MGGSTKSSAVVSSRSGCEDRIAEVTSSESESVIYETDLTQAFLPSPHGELNIWRCLGSWRLSYARMICLLERIRHSLEDLLNAFVAAPGIHPYII